MGFLCGVKMENRKLNKMDLLRLIEMMCGLMCMADLLEPEACLPAGRVEVDAM
jgi:hypothetical protein